MIWAGSVLAIYLIAYQLLCMLLPTDSTAALGVSNIGFCLLEVVSLFHCYLAFRWTREDRGRLIWLFVGLWLALNLFADCAWTYDQLVRQIETPVAGAADIGYALSYAAAFIAVLIAAWKSSGRLRMIEIGIDAAMLTLAVAGLLWPFILGPMLDVSEPGTGYWLNFSFCIGDLLIVFAFASFFLAQLASGRRPRRYYSLLAIAFVPQVVADAWYFVIFAGDGEYSPGNWLDFLWLASFALAGFAAFLEYLMGKQSTRMPAAAQMDGRVSRVKRSLPPGQLRTVIPYLSIVILATMIVLQLRDQDWRWALDSQVLTLMGIVGGALILTRQYVVLTQNRRLNDELRQTSLELTDKVESLADLNRRLDTLNQQVQHLNTLRDIHEVAKGGLELACSFSKCPGGWLTARNEEGADLVIAVRGQVDQYHPGAPKLSALGVEKGILRAIPLEIRGEALGTVWLVRPAEAQEGADLLPVIATHIATALDNAKQYEEAVHLAERDALTGLYNHRGIHRRLAGEALRAQQNGSELSLVMMDLDDFKTLNDTYGHPAGDAVLRQVSDAIRSVLRHADLAGRVGGDELLIVLPNTSAEGALQFCERLRAVLALRPYVTADGQALPVRFSLGLATYPEDAQSLGQLIETVDANLYASKQRGGDTTTGSPHESRTCQIDAGGVLGVAGRLLNVVGARDHYTRRHSEHVALYALSLGEAAGLSDSSLSTLHIAAMLHDVGKIGVAGDLLRKPGSLEADEEDMVRRHVDMSASVITDMPRLAEVAEAVRAHHEHYDGTGYPAEARGDDIPLLGRILAIADAYSAMTLDRPYRRSLAPEQARRELQKAAGTQFDPVLVERFLRILDAQTAGTAASNPEASAG